MASSNRVGADLPGSLDIRWAASPTTFLGFPGFGAAGRGGGAIFFLLLTLLLLSRSAAFASGHVQTSTVGTQTITITTFDGSDTAQGRADVNAVKQAFDNARDKSPTFRGMVQAIKVNFPIHVNRSQNVQFGSEDGTTVTVDPGDLARGAASLTGGTPDDRTAVANSLLIATLAHEIAGRGPLPHNHGILRPKTNDVLRDLKTGVEELTDCIVEGGNSIVKYRVGGAGGRVVKMNVTQTDPGGQFVGACRLVERTLIVNSTVDENDGLIGDGVCDIGSAVIGFTGICTLRAALEEGEGTAGLDAIHFNIPAAPDEIPTIRPRGTLGSLGTLRPVIIDGTTQPAGLVELDGSTAGPDLGGQQIVGLDLVGEDSIVLGLVINRFGSHGIHVRPSGAPFEFRGRNFILANLIGTDATGAVALPNQGDGVHIVDMPGNVVQSNLVSANAGHGVVVEGFEATDNVIGNNLIGTDAGGQSNLGNGKHGVLITDEAASTKVVGNLIAFNAGAGVRIESTAGIGNNTDPNSIFGNGGLGIDIGAEGPTPTGVPVLASAIAAAGVTTVQGSLASTAGTAFVVEFFASRGCHASGFGEGETFLDAMTLNTDATGNTSFIFATPTPVSAGDVITATATDPNGNTSEFSSCLPVDAAAPNTPPVADAGPDQTVECTGPGSTPVTLNGAGSTDPDGDLLTFSWRGSFGIISGPSPTAVAFFPLGRHDVTLTVEDGKGGVSTDGAVVTVQDTIGPTLTSLVAKPSLLWPPNHRMVSVRVFAAGSDLCEAPLTCRIIAVNSNEETAKPGAGKNNPDWRITGPLTVDLRAERSGKGRGRVYTLTVECLDDSGNRVMKTVAVTVPHDRGK